MIIIIQHDRKINNNRNLSFNLFIYGHRDHRIPVRSIIEYNQETP